MDTNDYYTHAKPSAQNAVDLFKDEWSSYFPQGVGVETGSHAGLFHDERVDWALAGLAERVGDFAKASCLEIGPLEGGHTYMLEQAGFGEITAIESNSRAYLKCLISKEVMRMSRAHFLFGDIFPFLRENEETYDLTLASGVLYHMTDPVELIGLIAKRSRACYVWTHVYDTEEARTNEYQQGKWSESFRHEHAGFACDYHPYAYNEATTWRGFCGGSRPSTVWMSREDLLAAWAHFGFELVAERDEPNPHGKALSLLVARR